MGRLLLFEGGGSPSQGGVSEARRMDDGGACRTHLVERPLAITRGPINGGDPVLDHRYMETPCHSVEDSGTDAVVGRQTARHKMGDATFGEVLLEDGSVGLVEIPFEGAIPVIRRGRALAHERGPHR